MSDYYIDDVRDMGDSLAFSIFIKGQEQSMQDNQYIFDKKTKSVKAFNLPSIEQWNRFEKATKVSKVPIELYKAMNIPIDNKLQHFSGGLAMEHYLIHHGVQGMKWGVMHGPPYPLTGENKKAFKADKKALLKADKKRMQLDSNYAKDRYNGSYNKAQYLRSTSLNAETKSAKKTLLKTSKIYEKDANRAFKQLPYGKAKRPGKIFSFLGGGPLGMHFYNLLQKPTDEIYKESIRNPNTAVNKEIEAMINEDLLNKSMKYVLNDTLSIIKSDQIKKPKA